MKNAILDVLIHICSLRDAMLTQARAASGGEAIPGPMDEPPTRLPQTMVLNNWHRSLQLILEYDADVVEEIDSYLQKQHRLNSSESKRILDTEEKFRSRYFLRLHADTYDYPEIPWVAEQGYEELNYFLDMNDDSKREEYYNQTKVLKYISDLIQLNVRRDMEQEDNKSSRTLFPGDIKKERYQFVDSRIKNVKSHLISRNLSQIVFSYLMRLYLQKGMPQKKSDLTGFQPNMVLHSLAITVLQALGIRGAALLLLKRLYQNDIDTNECYQAIDKLIHDKLTNQKELTKLVKAIKSKAHQERGDKSHFARLLGIEVEQLKDTETVKSALLNILNCNKSFYDLIFDTAGIYVDPVPLLEHLTRVCKPREDYKVDNEYGSGAEQTFRDNSAEKARDEVLEDFPQEFRILLQLMRMLRDMDTWVAPVRKVFEAYKPSLVTPSYSPFPREGFDGVLKTPVSASASYRKSQQYKKTGISNYANFGILATGARGVLSQLGAMVFSQIEIDGFNEPLKNIFSVSRTEYPAQLRIYLYDVEDADGFQRYLQTEAPLNVTLSPLSNGVYVVSEVKHRSDLTDGTIEKLGAQIAYLHLCKEKTEFFAKLLEAKTADQVMAVLKDLAGSANDLVKDLLIDILYDALPLTPKMDEHVAKEYWEIIVKVRQVIYSHGGKEGKKEFADFLRKYALDKYSKEGEGLADLRPTRQKLRQVLKIERNNFRAEIAERGDSDIISALFDHMLMLMANPEEENRHSIIQCLRTIKSSYASFTPEMVKKFHSSLSVVASDPTQLFKKFIKEEYISVSQPEAIFFLNELRRARPPKVLDAIKAYLNMPIELEDMSCMDYKALRDNFSVISDEPYEQGGEDFYPLSIYFNKEKLFTIRYRRIEEDKFEAEQTVEISPSTQTKVMAYLYLSQVLASVFSYQKRLQESASIIVEGQCSLEKIQQVFDTVPEAFIKAKSTLNSLLAIWGEVYRSLRGSREVSPTELFNNIRQRLVLLPNADLRCKLCGVFNKDATEDLFKSLALYWRTRDGARHSVKTSSVIFSEDPFAALDKILDPRPSEIVVPESGDDRDPDSPSPRN